MRHIRFGLLVPLIVVSNLFADAHSAVEAPGGPTADQAYRLLIDGQTRFATNIRTLPHQDENRRCETTTGGQHPVAAVLSCADSRVPPEMLFDQGIGDLFVIRVAGNVAATDELGTLEYGVEHLHIPLIVVLGHSKCGAVTAVVDGAHAEGNLAQLLKPIVPAADLAKHDHPTLRGPSLVSAAIAENVRQAMHDLTARSPVIAKAVEAKRIKIVGGVYDIHAGRVDWLSDASLAAAEPATATSIAAMPTATHDDHATPVAVHAVDAHAEPKPTADHAASHSEPTAAPKHAETDRPGAPHAAAHATPPADAHAAAPASAIPPKAAVAQASAALPNTLAAHWPVLGGLIATSTLIGAGITHVASRHKA